MRLGQITPLTIFIALSIFQLFFVTTIFATEEQCHIDCYSLKDRSVGPTRPWDAFDPLRNPLHLTKPYPYHIAANDLDKYDALPEFCKLGCTYFFVSSEDSTTNKSTLDQCLYQCDDKYSYNSSTPPYNDLAQVARLECRDGCLLALKRCQPGYYCIQVSFDDDFDDDNKAVDSSTNIVPHYQGGDMIPCPAGTYRNVAYNAITECIQCPPNYFREATKGKSTSSCSSCPAGTSAIKYGSTSIKDCIRCHAGTFSTEASYCTCITPQACAEDQLPPPADAEKKDTVPYIGRW